MRPLSLLEARVLGVLVEKSLTVPDSYPLSLNALTLGCNQKTARDPVLAASDAEVQGAVDTLKALSLAFESSGSRFRATSATWAACSAAVAVGGADRDAHAARAADRVGATHGERRLHRFADISAVEGFSTNWRRALTEGRPAGGQAAARAWRASSTGRMPAGPVDASSFAAAGDGG
jgi:hypothetical protein